LFTNDVLPHGPLNAIASTFRKSSGEWHRTHRFIVSMARILHPFHIHVRAASPERDAPIQLVLLQRYFILLLPLLVTPCHYVQERSFQRVILCKTWLEHADTSRWLAAAFFFVKAIGPGAWIVVVVDDSDIASWLHPKEAASNRIESHRHPKRKKATLG